MLPPSLPLPLSVSLFLFFSSFSSCCFIFKENGNVFLTLFYSWFSELALSAHLSVLFPDKDNGARIELRLSENGK